MYFAMRFARILAIWCKLAHLVVFLFDFHYNKASIANQMAENYERYIHEKGIISGSIGFFNGRYKRWHNVER